MGKQLLPSRHIMIHNSVKVCLWYKRSSNGKEYHDNEKAFVQGYFLKHETSMADSFLRK